MITKSNIALTNNFFQGFTDILRLLEKEERKREIFSTCMIGSKFYHSIFLTVEFSEMDRMDGGQWSPDSRLNYNLRDTVSRCTVQVNMHSSNLPYLDPIRHLFCKCSFNSVVSLKNLNSFELPVEPMIQMGPKSLLL